MQSYLLNADVTLLLVVVNPLVPEVRNINLFAIFLKKGSWKNIPISAASMRRETIGANLRQYLNIRRKQDFRQ